MTFAVGIFDLFTYTIPGALYLAMFGYVALRLDWVEPAAIGRVPTALLVVIIVLASYLLGYIGYPVGRWLNRAVPRRRERRYRQEFVHRVPAAQGRAYVQADPFLLLSAVQLHNADVAVEVTRLRAGGLMLRNAAPPLVLAVVAAIVEAFAGPRPVLAILCGLAFAAASFSLIIQYRRLSHWANLKTVEIAFWLPDIEEKIRPAKS